MVESADARGSLPAAGRHQRQRPAGQDSPFETHCLTCDGEGLQIAPAYTRWAEAAESLRHDLDTAAGPIEAGIIADQLKRHEASPPPGAWDWPCPDCRGLGAIPTGEGRAVLAFLDRHNRLPADYRPW